MFHSNDHRPIFHAACRSNLRHAATTLLRRWVCFSIAIVVTSGHAFAVDPQTAPAAAPRNATPFVRPTQYHLLPPIYRSQVDRVPTVADLVPVLDDSSAFQFVSGPARSSTRGSVSSSSSSGDWPHTEASHGRRATRNASGRLPQVGKFRPARIPSKYASAVSEPQATGRFQQQSLSSEIPQMHPQPSRIRPSHPQPSHIQQVQHQNTFTTGPGADLAPALFQSVESPYLNQPVQRLKSPVWENEGLEAGQWQDHSGSIVPWEAEPPRTVLRQVSSTDHSPIPDSMMSTAPVVQGDIFPSDTPMSSSNSIPMSSSMTKPILNSMPAPYQHEVHASSCQCDLCQNESFANPAKLFGQAATAIVAERQTTFQFDTLAWFSSSSSLPALATTSAAGTARNDAGILGTAGTSSLFSDDAFSSAVPGFRIQLGTDFAGYGGIDFEYLQLATRSENLFASSADFPILARPFFDVSNGNSSADVIAFPGESTGAIQVALDSRFRTAAIHYYQLAMEEGSTADGDQLVAKLQIGPRVATLQETLFSNDHSFDIVNSTSLQRTDALQVENLFVGGEVGLELNRRFRRVDLSAGVSVAAGVNRQKFQGNGQSVFTDSTGQTSLSDSGWLSSSVGAVDIKRNEFSVIPAAELGIGFQTKWGWKMSVGYNVMLWTNALRVTDQVPTNLDLTFGAAAVGGAVRPFSSLDDDSYLAHGISFGLERRW
ncbi:MAG: BBP7 family outer membrane beta-barrel protein [Fuerstiella sp.]